MLIGFLRRIIPSISALCAPNELNTLHMLQVQDRIRHLEAENSRLLVERDAALMDARASREQVTDWLAQRLTGKPIFGNGVNLNEINEPTPEQVQAAFTSKKRRARDIAHEMEAKFWEEAGGKPPGMPSSDPN